MDKKSTRFYSQRRIVVQLLKDYADQFGAINLKSERGGSDGGGHWLLTTEILRRQTRKSDTYASKRFLNTALRKMRDEAPDLYSHLKQLFLRADAAHSDYPNLQEAAKPDQERVTRELEDLVRDWAGSDETSLYAQITYWMVNATEAMKMLLRLDNAIDHLTFSMMRLDLSADFPAIIDRSEATYAAQRAAETRDDYAEIHRVFASWCKTLLEENPLRKRHRNKAIEAASVTCDVSVPTVQRAVTFTEDAEKHDAKTRSTR